MGIEALVEVHIHPPGLEGFVVADGRSVPGHQLLVEFGHFGSKVGRARIDVPALLTGNMERGARVKLAPTGLWELFAFGVYGGDGNAREDLPWVARERAWEALHESFRPADTILIGDTPNDARVARLNEMSSLIVIRRPEPEWRRAIEAEQPTWLVDGFEDVPGLIRLMKGK